VKFPFLVPGPAADCSVGIAIAHFKAPLQDVVREAQRAEKRAKTELDRSAIAVTLMKRSGETIHWGCRWDSGGLEVYSAIMDAMQTGAVSGKFPHRVVELLDGYLTGISPLAAKCLEPVQDFPVVDIARREFEHALERQKQVSRADAFARMKLLASSEGGVRAPLTGYLEHVRQRTAASHAGQIAKALATRARVETADLKAQLEKLARELQTLSKRGVEEHRDLQADYLLLLTRCQTSADGHGDAGEWMRRTVKKARALFERARTEAPLQGLIGLCQTVAFIERNLSDEKFSNHSSERSALANAERQAVP
jgi:hypothetical protein